MPDIQPLIRLYEEADLPCRYQRVAAAVQAAIDQGLYLPEEALPTQRELAEALGLTLGTVTHGYAEAAKRGLVTGVTGRGTFVCTSRPDVDLLPPALSLADTPGKDLNLCRGKGESSQESTLPEPRWNLGFIAPFEYLNPSLQEGLSLLLSTLSPSELSALQSYQLPGGMEKHREAGTVWAQRCGAAVSDRDLLICAGSQHALMTILMSLCSPGDRIAAETLSYPLLRHLAWRLRLNLTSVRTDASGMLPDALDQACRSGGVHAVYLMPSCRNPTLTRMPEGRRRDLLEVCRRHDLLIIEDDVFTLAVENKQRIPSFSVLAPERTCFIAATSEILGGGLRVAYLCPPQGLREELERTISYTISMVPPLMAELAAQWILNGTADKVLEAKRREAAARNLLAQEMLDGSSLVIRRTGFFCWLPLPEPWTGRAFADAARKRGLLVAEGEHFMTGHAAQGQGVRLALGGIEKREEIAQALSAIRDLLESRMVS